MAEAQRLSDALKGLFARPDHGWFSALTTARAVNAELATAVAALSDGIIAHRSYCTCEIISIRHMQGLWLERT